MMSVLDINAYQTLRKLLDTLQTPQENLDHELLLNGSRALDTLFKPDEKGSYNEEELAHYLDIIDFAPIGLIELDQALRITLVNNTALNILNYSQLWSTKDHLENRLIGKSFTSTLVAGVQKFLNWMHEGCQGTLEVSVFDGDQHKDVLLHGALLGSSSSRSCVISITPNQQQIEMRKSLLRYQQVFDSMGDASILINRAGVILEVNKSMLALTGCSEKDLIGQKADSLLTSPSERFFSNLASLVDIETRWEGEVNIRTREQFSCTELVKVSVILNKRKNIECFVVSFQDLSKVMDEQDRLERLANMDAMTNVYNRLYFNKVFAEKTAEAQRQGSQLVLFFMDLDKFKHLNDVHGHQYGDELLQKFAQRIRSQVRKHDLVARLGGDEFAVLMDGDMPFAAVETVAIKMISHLQEPYQLKDIQYQTTASIGIARYPEDALTAEELFINADEAMYVAKSHGRNNYQFFDKKLEQQALIQKQLEADVEYAIHREGLELYFQPQNDLRTGKVIGFEALARLTNEQNVMIKPNSFIPEAERRGLIIPLGKKILTRAFHTLNAWNQRGFELPISINVSALQLKDNSSIQHILNLALEFPHCIPLVHLEITETFFIERSADVSSMIKRLTDIGIEIVLDDFGTGYSSIYSLKRFPFKMIKIDKSFVQNIENGKKEDMQILKAMMKLIKILDLTIIAEGVETPYQRDFLINNGCDLAQGYYYSKPMPSNEVIKYLNIQNLNNSL